MAYEHNVFISFAHYGRWPDWLEECFLPCFRHFLIGELGEGLPPYVAMHSMKPGDHWPTELAIKLARSKTLLAICTGPYRDRPWCQLEFTLMKDREEGTGVRGLIVPVIAHDCENSPQFLKGIETEDVKNLTYDNLVPRSEGALELEKKIERIALAVTKAVRRAPEFQPTWENSARVQCSDFFESRAADKGRANPRI